MNAAPAPTWDAIRKRIAVAAVATAGLTAVSAAILGGTSDHTALAISYIVIAIACLFRPVWITAQVIFGQILAASLLLGPTGTLTVLPLVALVAVTAELLAAAARLETPLQHESRGEFRRAATAAAVAGAVFGAVALAARLPGPSGLLATGTAAGACVGLAILLSRAAQPTTEEIT